MKTELSSLRYGLKLLLNAPFVLDNVAIAFYWGLCKSASAIN